MQPAMRIIVSMALLASAIASTYHSNAKLRRDGVLNLYPFPRVGRASRNTWQLPLNDMYLAEEYKNNEAETTKYEPIEKRQLYAFPRVGRDLSMSRADSHEFQPMPLRRTESPGMWFGPRLGRAFKSDDDGKETRRQQYQHQPAEDEHNIEKRHLNAFARVGRDLSVSRDDDELTIPNETNDHSEPEQTEPINEDRRKRQTLN